MSDTYPSWLPKRPPPPVPASTYQSSADPHPRAADVFTSPGRKATPRSVRIVARDAPWREPTGDSAETRVPSQPQRVSRASLVPPPPRPRFRAPSLHLSLLRSPALSMRIRYMLHPLFIFGHLLVQTYFDFNVVFMLIQVSSHPSPNNSARNWSFAAAAYIACYALQLLGVFVLYELVYSFWRRWRVKRPLILPIYLSSPAHNLAALTSYTHFCFFVYIRQSARPPWPSLTTFRHSSSPDLSSPLPSSPLPSQASPEPSPPPSPSRSSSASSSMRAFSDYVAEYCYWRAQNTPTVLLLLPRAALSLSLLLAFSAGDTGTGTATARDPTYFDGNGALTGYARGVLLANAAWTAWRALVVLGSVLGLWILSGTACAGLCGPRYRWEEEREQEFDPWEKRLSGTPSELAYPHASDDYDAHGMSDSWSWKQGTRDRVREAWEFCLTNVRPGRGYETTNVRSTREKPAREEEFAGLEEVLAAVTPRSGFPQRSVLSSEFYSPAEGREALSDIIPPAEEVREGYGSQRSRRSDPLRVLPYPFKEFQPTKPGEGSGGGTEKGKEREVIETASIPASIPFPSPVPSPEEEDVVEDEEDEEEDEEDEDDDEEGDEEGVEEADEEDIVEGRRTSESMSSLGQPITSRYPFAFRHPARSSASASNGTPSHRTPHSATTSPAQSHSTPSTRGSRSTPSTRGSRVTRSTPSNRESSDSPRSPASIGSPEGPFIPPPPRNPHRRRRAGTAPSLSSSPLPVAGPSRAAPGGARARTRTISASNSSSSRSRGFDPEPEALYESDDQGEGRVPSPVADGSQEEAEKEDSVGLLSTAPSPKTSLAGIRSNLSHRRGNGSRSGSGSHSGSGSPQGSQGRSISFSESARSRAQSLIHSIGQRASLGEFGTRVRSRSRSSSVVRNSDSQFSDSPKSAADNSPGSRRASRSGSASGSATGTGSGRPSGEGGPGIEHTFGRPGELMSHQERLERLEARATAPSEPSPQPALSTETSTGLRHAASDMSGIAPSEATERVPAGSEMDQSRTDLSTAHDSFVTAPMTIDSSTTTEGGSSQSTETWAQGLRHHVPGGPWGHTHGHGPV